MPIGIGLSSTTGIQIRICKMKILRMNFRNFMYFCDVVVSWSNAFLIDLNIGVEEGEE